MRNSRSQAQQASKARNEGAPKEHTRSLRALRIGIFTTAIAIVFTFGLLGTRIVSPTEQMRIRNSLILRVGVPSDFDWKPGNWPASFRVERGPLPASLPKKETLLHARNIDTHSAWQTALELARHLASGPGLGSSIKSNTVESYYTILSENRGYCADYTQVFNGLAYAAGVAVREWGMTFDGYANDGHAFSEIFDPDRQKWIFLDTYYSFYIENPESGVPLSVLELRQALRSGELEKRLLVVPIDPIRFGFKIRENALNYYRRGADQFFLIFGNDVFTFDRNPVVRGLSVVSRTLAQGAAIVLGIYPKLVIIPSETNSRMIGDLQQRRNVFFKTVILVFILSVALAVEVIVYGRIRQ